MKNRNNELLKNTIAISIGKMGIKIVQFFLLPFYTSILSTEEYGTADLLNAYISLISIIVSLRIEQALFRYLAEVREEKEKCSKTITNVFIVTACSLSVFLLFFLLMFPFLKSPYKMYFITNVIILVLSNVVTQVSRGLGDYKTYAAAGLLTTFFMIFFNIIFLSVFQLRVDGLLISVLFGNIIGLLYVLYKKRVFQYINMGYLDKKLMKELCKYSFPLIPSELSWQIVKASDKFIVNFVLGAGSVGILSISTRFSSIYTEIYSVYNMSWIDVVVCQNFNEEGKAYINRMIHIAFRIFSSICIGMMAAISLFFSALVNETYQASYYLIPMYLFLTLIYISRSLFSGILIAKKKVTVIAKATIGAGIVNILVNLLLIKWVGIWAAPISSCCAYFYMFLVDLVQVKKEMEITFELKYIIPYSILFGIVLAGYYYGGRNFKIILCLVVGCFCFIVNKKVLKFLIQYGLKIFHIQKEE